MDELLQGLNPVQREIVKDTEGNLLVLAGAGSGKTRVLTHRIAYLLGQNIPAWQILAVTFTNKAAREMKERLINIAGHKAQDTWIGTFHGICLRILSRFGSEIGYKKFTIIDDKDQKKLVKIAIEACGVSYEPDKVLSIISNAKNDMWTPDDLRGMANHQHDKDLANIYAAYEEKKDELGYFDFDDLIMKTAFLLDVSEAAKEVYAKQFRYVLTDETQDTNKAQFKLLTQLSSHYGNLFAVGDSDQSIYGWRGADIKNIINFETYFPDTKLYKLEQNYRSTQTIVNASNALIANNQQRLEKTAFSEAEQGNQIIITEMDDESREADNIASVIKRTVNIEGERQYNEFAILYRTNRQSRAIEMALKHIGVPYQMVGGHAFYDRKEIKDIVAYLRAINNGVDALAFERIINVPRRGIGDTTVNRIKDYADECMIPFPKALDNLQDIPKITAGTKNKIISFVELIQEFRDYADTEDFKVADLIRMIVGRTGYVESLDSDKPEELSRIENIEELINAAGKWDQESGVEKGLTEFLAETSLVADIDSMEDNDNAVLLMTAHSSKGLEFPIVFLVGVEDGIFPHGRSINNPFEMEEERRLMYVAMTRAEEKLYISHCKYRYEYGNPRPNKCTPSRFLEELPDELVKRF